GGIARLEVDGEQAANHRLAVVGCQRPGKGHAVGDRGQIGLVLGPDPQSQVGRIRLVHQGNRIDQDAASVSRSQRYLSSIRDQSRMLTMSLYSSNETPVPLSFISPLRISSSVSRMVRVARISSEMP